MDVEEDTHAMIDGEEDTDGLRDVEGVVCTDLDPRVHSAETHGG